MPTYRWETVQIADRDTRKVALEHLSLYEVDSGEEVAVIDFKDDGTYSAVIGNAPDPWVLPTLGQAVLAVELVVLYGDPPTTVPVMTG